MALALARSKGQARACMFESQGRGCMSHGWKGGCMCREGGGKELQMTGDFLWVDAGASRERAQWGRCTYMNPVGCLRLFSFRVLFKC